MKRADAMPDVLLPKVTFDEAYALPCTLKRVRDTPFVMQLPHFPF